MLGSRPLTLASVLLFAFATSSGAAISPGQRCASTKTKETGKKINCKAKCDSKGVKTGAVPDPLCLTKCHDKFAAKFVKAEAKGGCATVGDEAAIEAKVDAHLLDLEATLQLGGPSVCTAAKYKEAGKKALCRLKCHAKAQKKGIAADSVCLQKCTDKFTLKCSGAEASADCLVAASCATLEAKIDAFVDDVVAELPTTPSTTSTSTTTSTTTSTAPTFFQACAQDPSRTIYAGDSGTGACRQFENQAQCEQAFHQTSYAGDFASCYWDGDCRGCGPENRNQGYCINTCEEGSAPTCAGDPTRTVFAGFAETQSCHQFDGNQAQCEQAFHMSGEGVLATCWWDGADCNGCGPNNQANGNCVNTCPVCVGDPTRVFAGGPGTSACHEFDGDQTACEQAFHAGDGGLIASCFYDAGDCRGCGDGAEAGECTNTCAVCPGDPGRVHVPGSGACHAYDGAPSSCSGAFHLSGQTNEPASCYYDGDDCNGCGPTNQGEGLCTNTCEGPICGDQQVNQPGEECDGDDDAACSGIGLGCRGDCRCERCTNGTVDPGEVCDTPGSQGTCPSGTTCNDNCTACLAVCGDGQVSGSEVCDYNAPGSCPAGESCDFSCSACQTVCGDGVIGGSEVCDPPGQQGVCPAGEVCDGSCSACVTASCPVATVIGSAGGVFLGSTVGGYTVAGSCGGSSSSPERYFQWTPNTTHVATIRTCGGTTNYDSVVYIWQGTTCGGSVIACNDDFCGLQSQINPFVVAGTTYTIVVDGFSGSQGNFTLSVSPSGAFLDSPLD